MTAEKKRLQENRDRTAYWRRWGPYLSERQWGTVREDYSPYGTAWDYFPHDHARSRAYRWGEDGIAGISDNHQRLCFAIALWNGADPILKERLFGLSGPEGNHAEDVKECYFYLDNTPSHAYMKYLYKYPQAAFPYSDLVAENQRRGYNDPEYELIDTGIFEGVSEARPPDDRYFDVFVEYAKNSPEDIYIQITINNRSSEEKILHLLPTLWFRNTWSWAEGQEKPSLKIMQDVPACAVAVCQQGQPACSPVDHQARVWYGSGCLLTLPVPDFSMPYNVMCLTLIVALIYLAGTWAFVLSWRQGGRKSKAA